MSSRIEDLEPVTRDLCEKFLAAAAAAGHHLRVTHTLRSMDEQLHLWAKGRELRDGRWVVVSPQLVVTKAKPGSSPHNFGMAFDVCWSGPDPYLHAHEAKHGEPDPQWLAIGQIGESLGLVWGGPLGVGDKFTFDRPHFQRRDWKRYIPKEATAQA